MGKKLPDNLNREQMDFLIHQLATTSDLLQVKSNFERFFDKEKIAGEVVQRISTSFRETIAAKRLEIYQDVSTIPISHSYNILSLAQSRIEYLLKNPKTVRQNRRVDETGREYLEDDKQIDEVALQNWVKLSQAERFNYLKLEIERIAKDIDKARMPATGFNPIQVNTGFTIEDGEETKVDS